MNKVITVEIVTQPKRAGLSYGVKDTEGNWYNLKDATGISKGARLLIQEVSERNVGGKTYTDIVRYEVSQASPIETMVSGGSDKNLPFVVNYAIGAVPGLFDSYSSIYPDKTPGEIVKEIIGDIVNAALEQLTDPFE